MSLSRSEAIDIAKSMIINIYTEKGPKEGWKDAIDFKKGDIKTKVLAMGIFGLIEYAEEINNYLKSQKIPIANEVIIVESNGDLKRERHYLILEIPKNEWDQKIFPIQKSLDNNLKEYTEMAMKFLSIEKE